VTTKSMSNWNARASQSRTEGDPTCDSRRRAELGDSLR
jgi:hypothetical protein